MDVYKDYKEAIICPYCFGSFSHKDVHFRMESFFDENNLNDEGYLEDELSQPDIENRDVLIEQTNQRKPFMIKDDEKYVKWWSHYGETTEKANGIDEKLPCPVFQLPILDPSNEIDQNSLKVVNPDGEGVDKYLIEDADGMVAAVVDRFGQETRRRVCPHCHNPLPMHYGKNDVKFISVIGITGSGKTVYLSQLLRLMPKYAASIGMEAYPTSDVDSFIKNNPVMAGKPLPAASVEGRFSQPMVYDLRQELTSTEIITDTIVLYDIAGEDCQSPNAMQKYGKFVQHSSGIVLLVDPQNQLDLRSDDDYIESGIKTEPQIVLNTIHNVFLNLPMSEKCDIPLAVCVSKSDSILDYFSDAKDIAGSDVTPLTDEQTYQPIPEFNADEYNKLSREIKKLTSDLLRASLRVGFLNYNFFAFSATGCPTVIKQDDNGISYKYLKGPATPKRIAEPLFWMFYKFGYIGSNSRILLPEPRKWETLYRVKVKTGLFKTQDIIKRESQLSAQEKSMNPEIIQPSAEQLEALKYEE